MIYLLAKIVTDQDYWLKAPYPLHATILLQYFGLVLIIRLPVTRIRASTQSAVMCLVALLLTINTVVGCFWLECIREDPEINLAREYLIWVTVLMIIPISIIVFLAIVVVKILCYYLVDVNKK